jgi:hypothetical protein
MPKKTPIKSEILAFRIDPKTKAHFQQIADQDSRSLSNQIMKILVDLAQSQKNA